MRQDSRCPGRGGGGGISWHLINKLVPCNAHNSEVKLLEVVFWFISTSFISHSNCIKQLLSMKIQQRQHTSLNQTPADVTSYVSFCHLDYVHSFPVLRNF